MRWKSTPERDYPPCLLLIIKFTYAWIIKTGTAYIVFSKNPFIVGNLLVCTIITCLIYAFLEFRGGIF